MQQVRARIERIKEIYKVGEWWLGGRVSWKPWWSGQLINLLCPICQGQTLHIGIDKPSISAKVEEAAATLTWFGPSAELVYCSVDTVCYSYSEQQVTTEGQVGTKDE